MRNTIYYWLVLVVVALVLRLITMAAFPLVESTEPRYAEISRLMMVTGDWITPWFTPGIPFWAKPPLSFWGQSAALSWLGDSVFAVRLPSWLVMIGCVFLTARLATLIGGKGLAHISAALLITMLLPYLSAGSVMTDAYLCFGVLVSLLSFMMVLHGNRGLWPWYFFIGLSIGLLAKGPIGVVLAGMPLLLAGIVNPKCRALFTRLPWVGGGLLTLVLSAPWYLAAELKTPGFLNYFLVGEHYWRFVDSGWNGDLYGRAHSEPKGMIWIFWLGATFPWGILILFLFCKSAVQSRVLPQWRGSLQNPAAVLLAAASLWPLVFFTFASNILWTYLLPAMPTTAILMGRYCMTLNPSSVPRWFLPVGAVTPAVVLVAGLMLPLYQHHLDTEAFVVERYKAVSTTAPGPLYYVHRLPFSARFYSGGEAQYIALEQLESLAGKEAKGRIFLAVPKKLLPELPKFLLAASAVIAESKKYQLLDYSMQRSSD